MREVRGLIPRISTTFLWLKIQKSEWSGKWNFLILLIFLFSSKKKINYITHAVSLSLNTRSQLTRQRSTYYYELSVRERERERESVSALPISSHPKNHNHMARIKHPAHKNPNRKKLSGSLSLSLFLLYMSVCINFFLGFWFVLFQIAPQEEEGPQHLLQEP